MYNKQRHWNNEPVSPTTHCYLYKILASVTRAGLTRMMADRKLNRPFQLPATALAADPPATALAADLMTRLTIASTCGRCYKQEATRTSTTPNP